MDWVSIVCILLANLLMAWKFRTAWVLNVIGSIAMIVYMVWFAPYLIWSVVVLNVVFAGQSLYGFIAWKKTPEVTPVQTPEAEYDPWQFVELSSWHRGCNPLD